MRKLILLLVFCNVVFSQRSNCGYDSCPQIDSNAINVHIVCHSHEDLGWVKTVKEYYYDEVKHILNSVVSALKYNPNRRFVQVETAFFHIWWQEQTDDIRKEVMRLVNNGQLEMVGGGWSMNDEATTHYQSIIDQFTLGLRFLNDTLGKCGLPKVAWQLEPFGHSREVANIFSQLGYDALFVGRVDYRDQQRRLDEKEMEFLWKTDSTNDSWLFTSILYNLMGPPKGLCFDVLCTDFIHESNKVRKVEVFRRAIYDQAKHFPTNNILISMGSDLHYQQAEETFKSIDRLIYATTNSTDYTWKSFNVFYSTPSCYLKAVNEFSEMRRIKYSVKTDDFFPYSDGIHSYWTGFFSSRPTLKRLEREGNNLLQITKHLFSFLYPKDEIPRELYDLQKAMGIMQHHAAITGTQKLYVAKDYIAIIHNAMKRSVTGNAHRIMQLINKTNINLHIQFDSCMLMNVSICDKTKADTFLLAVYNPLAKNVSHYIRVPVFGTQFIVRTGDDDNVAYQISPSISYLRKFTSPLAYELTFYAENIPAMGVKIYHVTANTIDKSKNSFKKTRSHKIGSELVAIEISNGGYVKEIMMNNISATVSQEFLYYTSFAGSDPYKERPSGAYIFEPTNQAKPLQISQFVVKTGDLFDELYQEYNTWAKQCIRIYKKMNYIEFDWIVGPIYTRDRRGKEVISRFSTDLNSDDTFYTDTNGRNEIKRVRNFRETYSYTGDEIVTSNYYPVVSKISIKDEYTNRKFSVLTDRSQGGSSLLTGQIELMLHRSLIKDDHLGMDEPLQDYEFDHGAVVRGQHHVILGENDDSSDSEMILEKHLQPWIFAADISRNTRREFESLKLYLHFEFSGIQEALPKNVHILTLEPWVISDSSVLLRLEYTSKIGDAVVNLKNTFTFFKIIKLTEMSLGADKLLQEDKQFFWRTKSPNSFNVPLNKVDSKLEELIVTLRPMQIRTFVATVEFFIGLL